MAETIAKATDVEVIYGDKPALDKINMSVKKGDIYALIGKNGAGKTTLLRLFTGQNAPDYGSIELFGKKGTRGLNEARKRTGAIIETPAFYPFFSAERNLEYYRIQRGIDDPSIVETVLKETGLYEAKDKKFKNFSLGMKQRLGIALSLMHDPEFLILDEPINGLDPAGIVEMRKLMLRLNKEKPISFSSAVTELLCDYTWPGNIRELQHTIEKAVILCESNVIRPKDILVKQTWKPQTVQAVPNLEEVERQAIETAILQNNGNLTAAAEQLGISRQTLYNKLKRFKP